MYTVIHRSSSASFLEDWFLATENISFFITKDKPSMLFKELIAVYCKDHTGYVSHASLNYGDTF